MSTEPTAETELTSATRTLRAARMRELQDQASQGLARLGFLDVQARKVRAEADAIYAALASGEQEYAELELAVNASQPAVAPDAWKPGMEGVDTPNPQAATAAIRAKKLEAERV